MTRISRKGLDVIHAGLSLLLLAAIPSAHAAQISAGVTGDTGLAKSSASMEQRVGLSRPGIGAGPYRSGITFRRLPNDPSPCGPKQYHLFINRPCFGRTTPGSDSPDDNNKPDTSDTHDKGSGGPVIVLGGSPYSLDTNEPSGNYPPGSGDDPPAPGGPHLPDHFEPTPEPTYMALTGLVFAGVWTLARRRRTA
jgi:hypothetical protein